MLTMKYQKLVLPKNKRKNKTIFNKYEEKQIR